MQFVFIFLSSNHRNLNRCLSVKTGLGRNVHILRYMSVNILQNCTPCNCVVTFSFLLSLENNIRKDTQQNFMTSRFYCILRYTWEIPWCPLIRTKPWLYSQIKSSMNPSAPVFFRICPGLGGSSWWRGCGEYCHKRSGCRSDHTVRYGPVHRCTGARLRSRMHHKTGHAL